MLRSGWGELLSKVARFNSSWPGQRLITSERVCLLLSRARGPAGGERHVTTGWGHTEDGQGPTRRWATLTGQRGPEDPNILWLFGASWYTQGTGAVGR